MKFLCGNFVTALQCLWGWDNLWNGFFVSEAGSLPLAIRFFHFRTSLGV